MTPRLVSVCWLFAAAFTLTGCSRESDDQRQTAGPPSPPIVAAARSQIGKTVHYDGSYVRLEYPMGDVPISRGVCTDVVVRALRDALGMDLQQLMHEDMKTAFSAYPTKWGLRAPDPNIDHRRVPNLRCYFERKGYSVGVTRNKHDYLPGDLVTCKISKLTHIMIVSDRKTSSGTPLVIHNGGSGTRENNNLFDYHLTGHYRITGPASAP
ncbi:MAG: DUF1287 domain-containing protein [Phycisphaerales bacterium]|nr:DUF1287 domain-containing protein [Phycisphaerales bacterium]